MMSATLERFFEGFRFKSVANIIMSFVTDDFSLDDFNRRMHNVLNDDVVDAEDTRYSELGTRFFDDNGFGPYARSDGWWAKLCNVTPKKH